MDCEVVNLGSLATVGVSDPEVARMSKEEEHEI
jgi:hypothetical protein